MPRKKNRATVLLLLQKGAFVSHNGRLRRDKTAANPTYTASVLASLVDALRTLEKGNLAGIAQYTQSVQ